MVELSPQRAKIELARRHYSDFVAYTKHDYVFNWHHTQLCKALQKFADGVIRKLMIFMPPQHGKSELATRRLPAYILGTKPTAKIGICSYSATLAMAFNRDIQRIIDTETYHDIWPDTILNSSNVTTSALHNFLRNSEIFEIVGHRGFVKTVGVGGSLTGTPIDIGIIDDPFKDREEAMSVRIRDKVYSWYTDVFCTRLHNDSQQLIIMTRWDQDDICGRILASENDWQVITYQAIKEKDIKGDPRQPGEALWPEKHSLERLLHIRETSPLTFNSLYQQDPKASKDILVFPDWHEYDEDPDINPVYGIDFGFSNHPTALVQVKKHNNRLYIRELIYQKQLLNSDLIRMIKSLIRPGYRVIADSAEPKTIKEMSVAGVNITGADKGPDSVLAGINWMKDHEIYIHKDSINLKNEFNNYQWVMYGGSATNIPIDSFNHGIDAIRYSRKGITMSNPHISFHR